MEPPSLNLRRVIEINLTFVYVVFLVGVSNHLIIKVHSYKTPQSLYPPRSWFKGCVKIFNGDFANSLGKALCISLHRLSFLFLKDILSRGRDRVFHFNKKNHANVFN